jgi:hypothetical protein
MCAGGAVGSWGSCLSRARAPEAGASKSAHVINRMEKAEAMNRTRGIGRLVEGRQE